MTTYSYCRTEFVNGTKFIVGRSEGGNGPPQLVRIAMPADVFK